MATEESVNYYRSLMASPRPRTYFVGQAPDEPTEQWHFGAVEDDDELVVIRQLTIEGDGTRHAYSADHIEDTWGFLTDQPLDDFEYLSPSTADAFNAAWDAH
jgi:hypothetical protein